ncbi:PTS sugar transporter subunit IIA [Clostridium sp. Marseille-P3244]|uniref:PTS sugar transporter subunit IIA n=1 Tax=Clostridium sp. Marseille-P3244 TaxID=1871020 RepID=UPI00092FF715|nr:PTS sugar transporter subunit IIA [Clostridium sp. Marseille-P3244]
MSIQKMTTNTKLILLKQKFKDSEEVISTLGKLAMEQGLVNEDYLPAILEREKNYPTGLDLPVNIAIPHIDTGVNRSFVSIATLEEPVTFYNMDCSGSEVKARIVFVFGIMDPKDQLAILRKFAGSFADKGKIQPLLDAQDPEELIRLLNELLDQMLAVEEI